MKAMLALLSVLAAGLCAANPAPAAQDSGARVEEWPAFLEGVRQRALGQIEALPNFICVREMSESAKLGAIGNPRIVTSSRVEVSYNQGKENYRTLKQGAQAPDFGLVSTGEFGGSLDALFDPASNASFRLKGFQNIRGRKAARIQYQVPQETSQLAITLGQRRLTPAYEGECWADEESRQVVRLQLSVPQLPPDFNIQKVDQSVEYDQVRIGERTYWLPVSAVSTAMLVRSARNSNIELCSTIFGFPCPKATFDNAAVKIIIKFKNYRKFETESKLITE